MEIRNVQITSTMLGREEQTKPINSRPQFVIGRRGSGKTTRIIKEACETGGIIVCPDNKTCGYIYEFARELNCRIRTPINYVEMFGLHNDRSVAHYFDEYGRVMEGIIFRTFDFLRLNHAKTVIIDESSFEHINDFLAEQKVVDMDGKELTIKIEVSERGK